MGDLFMRQFPGVWKAALKLARRPCATSVTSYDVALLAILKPSKIWSCEMLHVTGASNL